MTAGLEAPLRWEEGPDVGLQRWRGRLVSLRTPEDPAVLVGPVVKGLEAALPDAGPRCEAVGAPRTEALAKLRS